jgi:L-threonylcarbamoyladenylate synthase
MTTIRLATSDAAIAHAATIIRQGGLVAFPTETVYGLGADALSAAAAARIFEAKQRTLNDPLIVHIAAAADVERVADLDRLPPAGRAAMAVLIDRFWPGPLTLVLPRRGTVPALISAGLDSVAVRVPDHPTARALIAASGTPIAAPSANRFGHVSPTTADHVLADLDDRIDMVLDGGPTRIGVESTVVSLLHAQPRILRPGGVTREQLRASGIALDKRIGAHSADSAAQPAPGMLASHYAPRARVVLHTSLSDLLASHAALRADGARVGALLLNAHASAARAAGVDPLYLLGDTADDAARALYAGLRALDASGVATILAIEPEVDGLGEALRDRLTRAAAKR